MSLFIDDELPALHIDRGKLCSIVSRVISLWPKNIDCIEKVFGIENYSCRNLALLSRDVRERFEGQDWGDDIDFAGIALDFVGLAIKNSSRYLTVVRAEDLDINMIISNINARDDVIVK